jgi:hypothetical protein
VGAGSPLTLSGHGADSIIEAVEQLLGMKVRFRLRGAFGLGTFRLTILTNGPKMSGLTEFRHRVDGLKDLTTRADATKVKSNLTQKEETTWL